MAFKREADSRDWLTLLKVWLKKNIVKVFVTRITSWNDFPWLKLSLWKLKDCSIQLRVVWYHSDIFPEETNYRTVCWEYPRRWGFANEERQVIFIFPVPRFFLKKILEDINLFFFVGPLIPLLWTSGDVSSGFQSQGGQPYLCFVEAYMLYVPWSSPLVQYPTSWWLAW